MRGGPEVRDLVSNSRPRAAGVARPGEGTLVLGLCGVAYAVGFANLLLVKGQPYFRPVVDALYFDVWAMRLAAGDWLDKGQGAFFQTPLYPYFLGGLYTVFGRNHGVVLVLQVAAAAGTVALLYSLGRKLFGSAAGALAALAYALYGPLIMWEATLLKVVWEGLLTVGSLAAVLWAEDRPRGWKFAPAGALIALLSALRQNALLLVPLVVAYLLWGDRRALPSPGPAPAGSPSIHPPAGLSSGRRMARLPARIAWCAWLLLGAAVVIAPIAIRNYVVEGDLVLIADSTGQTLYWENHPVQPGEPPYPPPFVRGVALFEEEDYRAEAERRAGRPLKTSEVSRYWTREALRFALSEPGRYLGLCLKRLGEFFSAFEKPDNYNYYFARRFSPILSLPLLHFGVVGPLGLVGLALGLARRRRLGLLVLYVLVYAGTAIPAFVNGRYRFPIVPLLCLGAGFLLTDLWEQARALLSRGAAATRGGLVRGWARAAAAVAAVVALAVVCNWGVAARAQASLPGARLNLSDVYCRLGQFDAAARELELAVAARPDLPAARAALGRVYLVMGRYPEARRELEAAADLNPVYVRALDLARARAECGDLEGAADFCREALKQREDPGLRWYLEKLKRRLGETGGGVE